MSYRRITGIMAFVVSFGILLTACNLSVNQVAGIYAGSVPEASGITHETWLQLFSDGSFKQREIRYTSPISTIFRDGQWSIKGNYIVLSINGEKDFRFSWEHGFLRNEAASRMYPQLPLDMVALQRIGQ